MPKMAGKNNRQIFLIFLALCIFSISIFSLNIASAEYSIDVSLNQESYSVGEEILFTARLLDGNLPLSKNIDVVFSDILGKKQINMNVVSNQENKLLIAEDFPSGSWNAVARYNDEEGKGVFFIREKTGVEFLIEGDKLIIKNTGNTRYTRTISITIGSETSSLKQDIKVNGQKEFKLIAPKGFYDIKITDGENSLNKKSVELFGTGNAVGPIDESLIGTGMLGGPIEPDKIDSGIFSSNRTIIAFVFIGVVFILGILLLIESRMRKR